MNRKLISKSNYILKKVLNKEENIDILQDIIESIIGIEISKIKIKPYLEKMSKYLPSEENFGIVDVRIKTKDGQELNVGMQIIDGYYVQNMGLWLDIKCFFMTILYVLQRKDIIEGNSNKELINDSIIENVD